MNKEELFDWIPLFEELAKALLRFENRRKELVNLVMESFSSNKIERYAMSLSDKDFDDIDPFSVFASFNRQTSDANRKAILSYYKSKLGLNSELPKAFNSIPVANALNSCFYNFKEEKTSQIDNLWELFRLAVTKRDNPSQNVSGFGPAFERCINIKNNGTAKITMALYWIGPRTFVNLDSKNVWFIYESGKLSKGDIASLPPYKLLRKKKKISFQVYESIRNSVFHLFDKPSFPFHNLSDLSFEAWRYAEEVNNQKKAQKKGAKPEPKKEDAKPVPSIKPEPTKGKESSDYSEESFLREVFVSQDFYRKVVALLRSKKNIILQGPPGVGKTFATKRLAYAIMGEKDDSRIASVQFHQSYSYEDFVQGYKPTESGGFELRNGIFHDFCEKAASNPEQEHFFIIDEINRGNISRIFGEMLTLIEGTHRGKDNAIPLAYEKGGKPFFVPENLYIIGMMNTADRSLALLDYALRRRFAFVTMDPAFETGNKGFDDYVSGLSWEKLNRVLSEVRALNKTISEDASLGKGFRIGHSYFTGFKQPDEDRLRAIVEFEIIPTIEEYFIDDEKRFREWRSRLLAIFE